ncbi:Fic family protein [Patescibacteria group bacterium]
MYSPKYSISNKILTNIGQIEASKEVIENAPLVPSFEKQFQSDAIVRTVFHGTHIEGNDLTLTQTKKILEGGDVYGRPRDIQEVINYRNVMQLLDDLSHKRGEYDPEMLLEIHKLTVQKIVAEEKVGVLRKTQVVVKDEVSGKIIFQPPTFVEVPFLIEDFFTWLNSDLSKEMHPVIKAGIAHYILVAIHPFVEGNGRAARAFTTLVLVKEGYDIKRFFSLEEHFDDDPSSYYESFSKVDKQSKNIAQRDLTLWLEYFTEVVAVELAKIKEKVRKLSMDTRLKTKFGEQISLSERQMRLVEYISDQGGATVPDLRSVVAMVSDDTILRDLVDMIEKGVIVKQGRTKASRYKMAGR